VAERVSSDPNAVAVMNAAYKKYRRIYPATRKIFNA
jgi:hypothetical protein